MKKILSLILALALLSGLAACKLGSDGMIEPVEFYYLRPADEILYSGTDVILSETREASGHAGELDYLLGLYLMGPSDTSLRTPFPVGCRLMEVSRKNDRLNVTLSASFLNLEDMDLTLACACLCRTCFGITDAEEVQISAAGEEGTVTLGTFQRSSFLLEDDTALTEPTEETQS